MSEQADDRLRPLGIRTMSKEAVQVYGMQAPKWFVIGFYKPGVDWSVNAYVRVDPTAGPIAEGIWVHDVAETGKSYKDAVAMLKGAPMDALLHQAVIDASNSRIWDVELDKRGKSDGRGLTEQEAAQITAIVGPHFVTVEDAPRPPRRRTVTPDLLRDVAQVYRKAYAEGLAPTEAVARHYVITKPTAARWVREARKVGALGPAIGTTGGEREVPTSSE